MWMLFLFSAALLVASEASVDCSNGATAQTQSVRGPRGETAQLKLSTHDDAAKDSHDCMVDYQVIVQPAGGGAPFTTDFLSSDGGWGRKISARVDGFSPDGKRAFGTLIEGGATPTAVVFDFQGAGQSVELLDIRHAVKQMAAAKCGTFAVVAGTTDSGEVVIESKPSTQFPIRWAYDPATKRWRALSRDQSVHALIK